MSEKFKTYNLELKPLTPIIIGSGEELDAYEYVIHQDNDGNDYLYAINWLEYINSVPVLDRAKIIKAIESCDVMQVRQFLQENATSIVNGDNCIRFKFLASKSAMDKYRGKNLDLKNDLLVSLHQRTSSHPFIPGSSLKGAIRTSFFVKPGKQYQQNPAQDPINRLNRKLEKILLGYNETSDDPFRSLKLGDSSFALSHLVDVTSFRHKAGKWDTMFSVLKEAIYPKQLSNLESLVSIDSRLVGKDKSYKFAVSRSAIVKECRDFYSFVYAKDKQFLNKAGGGDKPVVDWSWAGELEDSIKGTKEDGWFPVRLGWGTGKTGMTISVVLGDKEPITRRLAKKDTDEYLPIGWAICRMTEMQ